MTWPVIDGGLGVPSPAPVSDSDRVATPDYEDSLVLLKEGWYPIQYISHVTSVYRGTQSKVTIWLRLSTQDRHNGLMVPVYFNVTQLIDGPRENGRFKCPPRGNLYRDICSVLGSAVRADRVPLTRLAEFELQGLLTTVRKDWDGIAILPGALWVKRFKPLDGDADW